MKTKGLNLIDVCAFGLTIRRSSRPEARYCGAFEGLGPDDILATDWELAPILKHQIETLENLIDRAEERLATNKSLLRKMRDVIQLVGVEE